MDEWLNRLESALSAGGFGHGTWREVDVSAAAASDPSIVAFEDLISVSVGRLLSAAEKIGGEVLDATKIVKDAFSAQKELLIKTKQTQKPDMKGMNEFLKPMNEVIKRVSSMTQGQRSDFFNHLKAATESLRALSWISYTGRNCGISMPPAYVKESWQMAALYNHQKKNPNHVEWAKALKELYLPGLRAYVESHYPLGPVWDATGKTFVSAPAKAPGTTIAPPAPPPASLIKTESPKSSLKQGMATVFEEISCGKSVTSGPPKLEL